MYRVEGCGRCGPRDECTSVEGERSDLVALQWLRAVRSSSSSEVELALGDAEGCGMEPAMDSDERPVLA